MIIFSQDPIKLSTLLFTIQTSLCVCVQNLVTKAPKQDRAAHVTVVQNHTLNMKCIFVQKNHEKHL